MRFIVFLLGALLLFSCSQNEAVNYALFSGKIKNPNGTLLVVRGKDFNKKIVVDKEGSFSDTLKIKAGYYSFNDGKESSALYLRPGYVLQLSIDTKSFDESIHYNGKGANENNYLAKKFLLTEKETGNTAQFYSMDEKSFLSRLLIAQKMLEGLLDNDKTLDKNFVGLERKAIRYHFMASLQKYPDYHKYFTHKEKFEVSDKFLAPLKNMDYENEADYSNFNEYKSLVRSHFLAPLEEDNGVAEVVAGLKGIKSTNIKNDLAKDLYYRISPSLKEVDVLYQGLMEISADDVFKKKLTDKYEKVKNLVPGKDSPKFSYKDINGKTVALDDLKGKYVYVDVWATWCGPCLREIPHLKKLEQKYHRRKIAFVSISVDREKDFSTWQKMVKEKELRGYQLYADRNWSSDFVLAYVIESIPRFILIDKNGKIINADAPRPSDPKLITDYLNKLKRL